MPPASKVTPLPISIIGGAFGFLSAL